MLLKIILAVLIGGGIGLLVGYAGYLAGGQCPILCNPYVSTGLGVVIALFIVSRSGGVPEPKSPHLVRIESEAQFERIVMDPHGVALVEFYAPNCPACVRQVPVMDALADRFAGRAAVCTVDATKAAALTERMGITAVPTLVLFVGGEQAERFVGFTDKRALQTVLQRALQEQAPAAERKGGNGE